MTKKCTQCLEEKPLTEFYKDKGFKDGHHCMCKTCKNSKTQKWRENNREHYNQSMKKYNNANYKKLRLQRYKLSVEEYDKMLEQQNHKCAVCSKTPDGIRPLVIDHNHKTGKVRELLCYGCNRVMAAFDDNQLFLKLLAYLKKHE